MKPGLRRVCASFYHYFVFFLMIAFIITCCIMLFTETLLATTGITLSKVSLEPAAKLTFLNVLFFSGLATILDGVRRKFTVDRPTTRITQAAQKIMQGDFSVRIEPIRTLDTEDRFNEIIHCFNKMAEELSGIETLQTDFVANVSHELKTPLAVMRNYGMLLQQPDLPQEKRVEYAAAVTQASKRLADLISNILRLNKLENQQIFPARQPFDLSEQLCQCLLAFEDIWEEKEIEIETHIEENVQIVSDKEMLSLVWNNLFSNALKFTGRGGKVNVSLQAEDGYVTVQVSDSGCGISKEVGRHIFEKFYQGDPSHATQGNGLGLPLVKRVIDITGSDISVESEPGKGSVFTVRLRKEPAEGGR